MADYRASRSLARVSLWSCRQLKGGLTVCRANIEEGSAAKRCCGLSCPLLLQAMDDDRISGKLGRARSSLTKLLATGTAWHSLYIFSPFLF